MTEALARRQRALDAELDAWCAEHPGPYRARGENALRLIAWADHHIARIDEELARLASRRGR